MEEGQHLCPQRVEGPFKYPEYDTWESDNSCSFCGSMNPDAFMAHVEAGDVELEPTDKNYKVYVVLPRKPGESENTLHAHAKFYFQHLSVEQRKRFVELLNEAKLSIAYPGRFYVLPFFIQRG
jgi:hypothetical protein